MWRVLKPATIAALVAAIFSAGGQTAQPSCVEWSKAGPIIVDKDEHPRADTNVVYQAVQKKTGGKIVNQSLCNVGGRFVYKLVVLGPTGEVTNLTVDALTGQF